MNNPIDTTAMRLLIVSPFLLVSLATPVLRAQGMISPQMTMEVRFIRYISYGFCRLTGQPHRAAQQLRRCSLRGLTTGNP